MKAMMRIPDIRQKVEEELAKGRDGDRYRIQHASQLTSNEETTEVVKRRRLLETNSSEEDEHHDNDDEKV